MKTETITYTSIDNLIPSHSGKQIASTLIVYGEIFSKQKDVEALVIISPDNLLEELETIEEDLETLPPGWTEFRETVTDMDPDTLVSVGSVYAMV